MLFSTDITYNVLGCNEQNAIDTFHQMANAPDYTYTKQDIEDVLNRNMLSY